jgi:hypothetical protein
VKQMGLQHLSEWDCNKHNLTQISSCVCNLKLTLVQPTERAACKDYYKTTNKMQQFSEFFTRRLFVA